MDETRDRGVKNFWNLRGVMDGFRRSLPRLEGARGGDERRLFVSVAELLGADGCLSAIVAGGRVPGYWGDDNGRESTIGRKENNGEW